MHTDVKQAHDQDTWISLYRHSDSNVQLHVWRCVHSNRPCTQTRTRMHKHALPCTRCLAPYPSRTNSDMFTFAFIHPDMSSLRTLTCTDMSTCTRMLVPCTQAHGQKNTYIPVMETMTGARERGHPEPVRCGNQRLLGCLGKR